VQVRYDEGVAIHIGPKPCAVARKGGGEASAGEYTGQRSLSGNREILCLTLARITAKARVGKVRSRSRQ
jgi:hypothetical protein